MGEDAPTADVTRAKERAELAKNKYPSGIETARDEKVASVQKDFDETLPEAKEAKNMEDKDAKATLAAKVGDQQEKQGKLDAAAKAHGHTKDEIWAANMPSQYLAQQKAKALAEQ